jgi:hypothetical protein
MGEAFFDKANGIFYIDAVFVLYGHAASKALALQMAAEVESAWNEPGDRPLRLPGGQYGKVVFRIKGLFRPDITADEIHANLDPKMNFFRVEDYSRLHISFVDEVGSNTGYFLHDNLLNDSTTAAHEFGHSLGLVHPAVLDIRGQGQPGIMYPRGTWVDAPYQWEPGVAAGEKGGTLNPMRRKVLHTDILDLHLERLPLNDNYSGIVGDFTNLYHNRH